MRYKRDAPDLDFSSPSSSFTSEAPKKRKSDPLEEFLRLGSAAAPAVGTGLGMGIGALAGGLPTGGIGAVPGAMLGGGIGGALGTAAGGLMGYGAEKRSEPAMQEEDARMRREMERQARAQAALQMFGGL